MVFHKVLILFFLFPLFARAEYRVFSITINNSETQVIRQVETTLDPEQFKTLYPLGRQESIYYVDTWICRGRTNFFKPHCAKPQKVPPPSSATDQGRAPASSQSPELL